ncbi:MAG: hypothetical protein Q7R49_00645 [Candidatus Daviesbacteria bacterium]|nr:hypothetical protein [Candidatus Daviesbacteria bacterium]
MVEREPTNPTNPLNNLDFRDLFAALDAEYSKGGKFGLSSVQREVPQDEQASKGLKDFFIGKCITSILSPTDLRYLKRADADIRDVANYFRKQSKEWRESNIAVSAENGRTDEAEIIKNLTYEDMTAYANDRFKNYVKESGRSVPSSENQRLMQNRADYWAWIEQITEEAAYQEKKNPN